MRLSAATTDLGAPVMSKRMIDEASVYLAEKRAGVYDRDFDDVWVDEDEAYDRWKDSEFDEW